jgi:dTDP-4-dehydrorhamnose reductase
MSGEGYLVIGGDGLVGGGLVRALAGRGHMVLGSTRRADTVGEGRVFLDFEKPDAFRVPEGIGYAFVVAATTNYDRCETDPMARVTNVELIPQTIANLLRQGVFVTFISTNSVFGGERPWPKENDPHDARIAYARQKSEGEDAVRAFAAELRAEDRLNIVRLTKILNRGVSPLPNWFSAWQRGEPIEPFSDLVFAPMTVRFVANSLATLGEKRVTGNLHLSGAENVSYPRFAEALADRMGVSRDLIRPTTSVAKGIHIAFKPTYSGLGMERTTSLTGLAPQPFEDMVGDLVAGTDN